MIIGCVLAVALGVASAVLSATVPDLPVALLVLGAPIGFALLVVAFRRFDLMLLLLLAIRPLFDPIGADAPLSPSTLLGIVFFFAGCWWLLLRLRRGELVAPSAATIGLSLIVVAAAVSCLVSSRVIVSGIGTVKLASAILMFVLLEQCLLTGVFTARQVTRSVLVATFLVTIISLLQAVTGTGFYDGDIGLKRTYLPFVHPNVLAKFLDVALLVTLGHALLGEKRWRSRAALASAGISVALLTTYARVGWATAGVTALYLLWRRDWRIVPVAVVGGLIAAFSIPSVYGRIAELWTAAPPAAGVPANSLEWRIEYWQHLIPMARISPINGLGYNMVQIIGGQDLYAHNVWVQTYVEMGVFGVIALLCAIGGATYTLWRTFRSQPHGQHPVELHIGVATAIALFIMMQTENLLSENTTLWYAAAALTVAWTTRPTPTENS